jgi:hypothetical protein
MERRDSPSKRPFSFSKSMADMLYSRRWLVYGEPQKNMFGIRNKGTEQLTRKKQRGEKDSKKKVEGRDDGRMGGWEDRKMEGLEGGKMGKMERWEGGKRKDGR